MGGVSALPFVLKHKTIFIIILQTHITFNPDDPQQFVSNNGSQVVFYHWVNAIFIS